MTTLQDISIALGWQIRVNENFAAVSPAALFSKRAATTTGLTLGYHGGILDGVSYNNGTLTLASSSTLYVVAKRSDGVVSSATGTTNWNNQTDYLRMGIATTDGVSITTWQDWREAYSSGGGGGGSAAWGGITGTLSDQTDLQTELDAKQNSNVNLDDIAALTDPGADRLLFWDDSASEYTHLTLGTNLSITGTTINAAGGGGGSVDWGDITGTLADQTDLQAALDAKGAAGIPQNSQSTAYTLVLSDANKHILHPSADTTARTMTIPANSSVAFPIGTAVTFVNQDSAGVMTIAITTDTMRLAGAGTTGSRTLAANGVATALKITSTEWIISGTGLT